MKASHNLLFVLCILIAATACDSRSFAERRLYDALQAGDTNYIQHYLSLGGDVDHSLRLPSPPPAESAPLLDVAIEHGQLTTVDFLLKRGANANRSDSHGDTPLIWAIAHHGNSVPHQVSSQILKSLLLARADPNLKSGAGVGWTPLIWAAMIGDSETLKILLANGAKVNLADGEGRTALHFAANSESVRVLIDAGADPKANGALESPEQSAVRLGHFDALTALTNASARTNGIGRN